LQRKQAVQEELCSRGLNKRKKKKKKKKKKPTKQQLQLLRWGSRKAKRHQNHAAQKSHQHHLTVLHGCSSSTLKMG
jgi:hypothetical protein